MRNVFENTFENGLSGDYDVILQPNGTYRYMKNCQLVSQDGHNFVVKDCLGNLVTFNLNRPYALDGSAIVSGNIPAVVGFISFPDKLIVHFTNDNTEGGGYGEIGRIDYLPYGEGVQPISVSGELNAGYTPLYHSNDLKYSKLHRIKGFSYIENELIERIYWTDNYNEPRTFNVSDPIFSTYFASGSLVPSTTYMILEGAIEYPVGSGNKYGPGLPNSNVFLATIPNTTYTNLTGTSPTPKIVEYYPVELLSFVPNRNLGGITFNRYGSGQLVCGSKIYYYRQGTNDGIVTSWSYGSAPVPVGTTNNYLSAVQYHNFVGNGTDNVNEISGLSVILDLYNLDTNFDYVEIACAEFDESAETPRQITIIYKGDGFTNVTHDGTINLGNLTISDLTLFPASILTCKTLATNKNYILAGNLTERKELDVTLTGATASVVYYPMNTHMDALSCSLSTMVYSGVSPINGGYNVGTPTPLNSITPFSRWKVTSGEPTVNTVTYNGTLYMTGEVITGVTGAGNSVMAFAGTGAVVPCVTKNKYTTVGSDRVESAIELRGTLPATTLFWDYKSAAVHHHMAGYWGGETYRFAVVFFDLKGNPYYARHLIDFQFPASSAAGIIRKDQIGNSGSYVYSLNPKIVKFSNIIISGDIIDKIKGFSIVRAERDGKVITQGLVMQCDHTGASPDVIQPSGLIPVKYSLNPVMSKSYSFLSPDLLCDATLPGSVGAVGDNVEVSSWVQAVDYSNGTAVNGQRRARGQGGSTEAIYSKLIEPIALGASAQPQRITFWADAVENAVTPVGGGIVFAQENSIGNGSLIDGTCGGGGDYTLDAYNGTGCKKSFFQVASDYLYAVAPGSGTGYSSVSGTSDENTTRILGNYCKAGFSNPYGGTGENALANTLYISTGHYQPINQQVKDDTKVGDDYIFNDVEVAGGDCFVCLADIGYSLWNSGYTNKYSYALTFPCECNSNYNLRRGRKTSNSEMYYTGSVAPNSMLFLGPGSEIRLEDYSYNKGYSTQGQNVVYPALPFNFINSGEFQARVRYAGQKFIGENVDSFRKFAIGDFKDLSYNYGRINDINVKEDKVIIWQDDAINTVPILERQVVSSQAGDATTLGTGGVVDRYDVISSFFGTQHQWSITETEYGFAWFDMRRKAFVILDFGGGIIEVSQVTGNKALFDEAFVEMEGSVIGNADLLLNSPTFSDLSDRPVTGVGIISVFDPKFKMTYMTFKFYGQKESPVVTKSKDFTIGYLHSNTKKCFVGLFDWFPYIFHNHNGLVISANNPKNTTQYLSLVLTNKVFALGDTLWGSDLKEDEYICIAPVTLDSAAKYPKGASGATYWTLINATNQLMVLNQPAQLGQATAPDYVYNKFDGRVVSNEIHIVVNPKMGHNESMEIQTIYQNGPNNVNYTDIYVEADGVIASDLNISATSRFYRFIRKFIASTPPLSTTGRVTNGYALFKFIKKNYTTNPTVVSTGVKILRSLTSIYNTKK